APPPAPTSAPTAATSNPQAIATIGQAPGPTRTPVPMAPPAPQPSPTPLPFLPASTLGTLPNEQAATVHQAQAALAAGDYATALNLLTPLTGQLDGDQQQEV